GIELYGSELAVQVVRFPIDLSAPVERLLDRLRPDLVALMELELWPNFLKRCQQRKIPVVLLNGRLTEQSFRNYRRIYPIARRMMGRLARFCVQDQAVADRFHALGVPRKKIEITGTMKFDTAQVGDRVE